MVAGAPDEGRIGGFERQHALLCQIYRILESAAKDSGHDLAWGWLLLGLSDPRRPTRRPLVSRARMAQGSSRAGVCKETTDDTCWKGNAQGQERAPFRRRFDRLQRADSCCGETKFLPHTWRTASDQVLAKAQSGHEYLDGAELRCWVVTLHEMLTQLGASQDLRATCTSVRHQNGWPMIL